MIVTEKEAKTKLCPFMTRRASVEDYVDPVRLDENCQASGCMAWKWANGFSPAELEARKGWDNNEHEPKGFCGA